MIRQHLFANKIGIDIVAVLVIFFCSLPLVAFSQPVAGFDIDDSDPVKLTSKIMEVHPEEGRLVVAEQQVWIVDFVMGNGQPFKTALENTHGNPISLETFAKRQLVMVQGFKLPDGRIIALRVKQVKEREKYRNHRSRTRQHRMRAVRPMQ